MKGMKELIAVLEGGEGSGNYGHAGRPGEVGGSAADGEDNTPPEDWEKGPISPQEYARLRAGRFKAGDHIQDKTASYVSGIVKGRGYLGKQTKSSEEMWHVWNPARKDNQYIPVKNAIAMGIR
jgi:hypothetical protein